MSVLVTVAPGCHFTIAPHPSGIPGMKPLVVYGGDSASVSELRADDLWNARLILHPVTGKLPPPYVAEDQRVMIEGGTGGSVAMWNGGGSPPVLSVTPQPPELGETNASDPSRVARRTVAVRPDFPRSLIDVTYENAMQDPVQINQQAADLPWPT